MEKNISYFVTGGFGLIGSEITNKSKGSVTVVSRTDKNKWRITNKNARVIIKNIIDLTLDDLDGVDVIYHCASTVDNYNILNDPYLDVRTNINGTIHLLELCKNLPKKPKFIYLSTFFVYGNQFDKTKIPINEDSPTDPLAIYPATKLCAENIIKIYSRLYGIPYLIFRFTNVYGEKEDYDNKKKGALNYLIMAAIKGIDLNLYEGGNFYRDYIHVEDVVSALKFLEQRVTNDLYLIGYGEKVLFKDIFNYIFQKTASKSLVKSINPPKFHKVVGIKNFVSDIAKIKKAGWSPRIDYRSGVDRVIQRYKTLI